jgi:hypothetical protein
VKVAVPSPETSACYDSQITQQLEFFNDIAAWRIDDADAVLHDVNAVIALLFRTAVQLPPLPAGAEPLD